MKKIVTAILISIIPMSAFSQYDKFKPGAGAKYTINTGGAMSDVSIAIVNNKGGVTLEIKMKEKSGLSIVPALWQQFKLEKRGGEMKLVEGFIQSEAMKVPERLTSEYLQGYDGGISMENFIFSGVDDFKGEFIGKEKVKTPAGETMASKYRHNENGQTIEYWISKEAEPIGLVKMISKGSEPKHNYTMSLGHLLKNVKAKINPTKAVELKESTKKWLPKPKSSRSMY